MSTTTTNLALFKYDPVADANNTYNITNALNNNWDTIDSATGKLSDLTTTEKGSLVGAINEVLGSIPTIPSDYAKYDMSNLTSTGKDKVVTLAHELDIDNALEISTTLQAAYVDYTPTNSGLLLITVGSKVTTNTANSVTVYIQAVDSNANTFILDGTQIIKPTGAGSISYTAQAVVVKGKSYKYYMSATGSGATNSGSAVFIPFKNAN